VSKGRVSLGMAGCLQYRKVNDVVSLHLYIILGCCCGLLLLLLLVIITVSLTRRRRRKDSRSNSTQQSTDNNPVQSRSTRSNIALRDLIDDDAGETGYSTHLGDDD